MNRRLEQIRSHLAARLDVLRDDENVGGKALDAELDRATVVVQLVDRIIQIERIGRVEDRLRGPRRSGVAMMPAFPNAAALLCVLVAFLIGMAIPAVIACASERCAVPEPPKLEHQLETSIGAPTEGDER